MLRDPATVLEVDRVSKLYSRKSATTRRRLAETMRSAMFGRELKPIGKLETGEFWALDNISFGLQRGEAIGIIGLNGSGKTSLLRILAGQILPDAGEVRMVGRTAAMIDATAGFQMAATGRENIYLRGAMAGRGRAEIDSAFDEILGFTELGDAIDAALSTYSSGMLMRLAFALMVSSTPDILFIDEVLAVGDFRFRQKCLARIREMRDRAAFVLVSHSMADIKLFCTKAIVLHRGRVAFAGEPEAAIKAYESLQFPVEKSDEEKRAAVLAPVFHNSAVLSGVEHYWCDADGNRIGSLRSGETAYFKVSFETSIDIRHLVLGVPVWSEAGTYVTGFSTELGQHRYSIEKGSRVTFILKVPALGFNPGGYISNMSILDGAEFLYRKPNPPLQVAVNQSRYWGVYTQAHEWQRQA